MFKGRKRLRFTGRTKGFVMALLMTALFALPMGAGAEEIGGIVYAFDEEAKTAAVTDIVDLAAPGKVTIPAQVEKDGVSYSVTALKWLWNASEQRANITGLVIPNTVTSADVNFRKFPNMTSATIPGSVKKFNGSFQFMTKLSGIVFGEGVEEIGSNLMVTDCSVLVSVKLPSTLKALTGPGIFSGAPWLGYYNPVELPEGITEIPDMTFRNCKYMKGVTAKGKITKIGQSAFSGCSNISTIPELGNVTEMGINAFKDCSKLEGEVDLSSLKEVPDSAFHFAHITGVKLSDQLEKVGANAFNSCRFTAVDLPSSLREIGSYAFCYARLNEITLPEGLETIGTGAYYGCKYDLSGTLEIPDSVTKIGADAFKGSTLDEIVVGKGVMEIGKNAFADMPNLSKVTIDNSPDIVHTSGAGWTDGVEVIYTIEGVGDVGDTIAEGGLTLQEAVNQSSPGDTIELKKPIKLSSTLNIPADKDVTICVKDENGLLMLANEEAGKKIEDMISVEAGAKLTLAGNLTISAINSTDSIIESSGAVTIEEGVTLSRAKITEMYSGVVDMKGAEAVLTINGGTIADNQLNNTFGGTVRATDGAGLHEGRRDLQQSMYWRFSKQLFSGYPDVWQQRRPNDGRQDQRQLGSARLCAHAVWHQCGRAGGIYA